MHLSVPITVELSHEQMRRVMLNYLSYLKQEQWVENYHGKLTLMHEVATSHKFDTPVDYQDSVRIKIVQAVQKFEEELKEYEASFGKDGRK